MPPATASDVCDPGDAKCNERDDDADVADVTHHIFIACSARVGWIHSMYLFLMNGL